MKKNLIGSKKHGWEIDNENKVITVYYPKSLFEKITNKSDSISIIHFDDIHTLNISYTSPVAPGAYNSVYYLVAINIQKNNGEYIEFEAMSDTTKREELITSIKLLQDSGIKINDKYDIMNKIINCKDRIWNILDDINKKA